MGDGRSELDQVGCEFGRMLAKDVANLKEDVSEIKADVKGLASKDDVTEVKAQVTELTKTVQQIDRRLAQQEWIRTAGSAGLSAVVASIVGAITGRR